MSSPKSILTLPSVEATVRLAKQCRALGTIGVTTGANGVGKTEALKSLLRWPPWSSYPPVLERLLQAKIARFRATVSGSVRNPVS
jgi:hypothetical protein